MSCLSRSLLLAGLAFGTALAAAPACAQPYSLIHSFTGATSDGDQPSAKLVADKSGRLYGTTTLGGTHSGGTVFRLTKSGKTWAEEILFSFSSIGPGGTLLIGPSGELYGTSISGGTGNGTVWRLDPNGPNWTLTTLHEFDPIGGHDGFFPRAGVVFGKDGLLYGTTTGTAPQDGESPKQDVTYGTVFSVSPQGDTVEYSVLHIFGAPNDGQFPGFGSLVVNKKGVLTGTTPLGGKNSEGMVFQLSPPKNGQTGWTETTAHDFGAIGGPLEAIGPFAGLVEGAGGSLFGCANGGHNGNGAIYTLTPPSAHSKQWGEQVLYNFGDQANDPLSNAVCDVSINRQGALFGSSSGGGINSKGAVFRVDPPLEGQTAWTEMVLHSFGPQGSGDAMSPSAAPIQVGKDIYGVTSSGGGNNRGAVYRLQP